jgi:hypothetical protein
MRQLEKDGLIERSTARATTSATGATLLGPVTSIATTFTCAKTTQRTPKRCRPAVTAMSALSLKQTFGSAVC